MTQLNEIAELIQKAKGELVSSKLNEDFIDDQDFIYQIWCAFKEDDVYKASPSLKKAFVAWVRYKAEDVTAGSSIDYIFGEIMDHVDGRNHIVIADLDDFAEACWDEWKEKKKVEAVPR